MLPPSLQDSLPAGWLAFAGRASTLWIAEKGFRSSILLFWTLPGASRVDEEVAHPHPSQTRMCRFPASGSSWESLARGGVDDTIRDSPAKRDSKVGSPPRFCPCQFSYPLSFRGQVCETQSSLPCFPSTVLSARHSSFLGRVPVSPVPRRHRYY